MSSSEAEQQADNKDGSVLPDWMSGGPHGLGEPNDRRLRKVEKDILIPKIVRERSRQEKCNAEFLNFMECSHRSGFQVVFKCNAEKAIMNECLTKWFHDKDFNDECKEQYLTERKLYRETGITKKMRAKDRTI